MPTALDRVVQHALSQMLGPFFESGFFDRGYGFRENRNAYQAVREVEAFWKPRYRHAVDCDLKSFFDTINHDRLMGQPLVELKDRKVSFLIPKG